MKAKIEIQYKVVVNDGSTKYVLTVSNHGGLITLQSSGGSTSYFPPEMVPGLVAALNKASGAAQDATTVEKGEEIE